MVTFECTERADERKSYKSIYIFLLAAHISNALLVSLQEAQLPAVSLTQTASINARRTD